MGPSRKASAVEDRPTVASILLGAAQQAVHDSLSELSRAEGKRGMVNLTVELCLGDLGQPLWVKSSAYFEQYRHEKDARETSRG